MWSLLHPFSYLAAFVAFAFVTLSLASGLLYVAELVEENTRLAKSVGQRAIYAIIALHLLFCVVDSLPWHLTAFGVFCHLVYLQNFSKTWPFISLTSIKFLASCVLVVIDHFLWFFYFADRAKEHENSAYRGRPSYRSWDQRNNHKYAGLRELTFMDVATFFGVCVWLVPFFLFLSLSANDNVLPSLGDGAGPSIKATGPSEPNSPNPAAGMHIQTTPRASILKVALDPILTLIPRVGKFRSSRSQRDGIIASPRPSAPPSPTMFTGAGAPSYNGQTSPFGPSSGYATYDNNSLSPEHTPYSARFAEAAYRQPQNGSPVMPLGPKRAATSPPGAIPVFTPPAGVSLPPPSSSPGLAPNSQNEDGIAITRSASPFGPTSAAGLVSRRKAG